MVPGVVPAHHVALLVVVDPISDFPKLSSTTILSTFSGVLSHASHNPLVKFHEPRDVKVKPYDVDSGYSSDQGFNDGDDDVESYGQRREEVG